MTVIAFRKPEPQQQHAAGEAFCICCGHTWIAVAPTGTTRNYSLLWNKLWND
jgi:hypothetical protein